MRYYCPDFKSYIIDDETEKAIKAEEEKRRQGLLQKGFAYWRKSGKKFVYVFLALFVLEAALVAWDCLVNNHRNILYGLFFCFYSLLMAAMYYNQWRDAMKKVPGAA